jgi:pilus assembly protein Flp/PilA
MKRLTSWIHKLRRDTRGSVFVEYILLLTIVGIGVIVGIAVLRDALIDELKDLAAAIKAIIPSP